MQQTVLDVYPGFGMKTPQKLPVLEVGLFDILDEMFRARVAPQNTRESVTYMHGGVSQPVEYRKASGNDRTALVFETTDPFPVPNERSTTGPHTVPVSVNRHHSHHYHDSVSHLYTTRMPKQQLLEWARRADAEATLGLRAATLTFKHGDSRLLFQTYASSWGYLGSKGKPHIVAEGDFRQARLNGEFTTIQKIVKRQWDLMLARETRN